MPTHQEVIEGLATRAEAAENTLDLARAREASLVEAIRAFIAELGDDARLLNLDQRSMLKRLYVLAGEAR